MNSKANKIWAKIIANEVFSEDELIHCFKENQPCSAGLQRLKVMANTIDDEKEDSFVPLSDSDVEQEAINELDSDDENDEIIDI